MTKQKHLHPGDVVAALQLALTPDRPIAELAESVRRSIGEAHNAIERLRSAGLIAHGARRVEREPLIQFIRWGVPFAFPATTGGSTVGIATAMVIGESGREEPAQCEFVWPSAAGKSRGESLTPLHPRVPELAEHNPRLRYLLALVDLTRVGGARERSAAIGELERAIGAGPMNG